MTHSYEVYCVLGSVIIAFLYFISTIASIFVLKKLGAFFTVIYVKESSRENAILQVVSHVIRQTYSSFYTHRKISCLWKTSVGGDKHFISSLNSNGKTVTYFTKNRRVITILMRISILK